MAYLTILTALLVAGCGVNRRMVHAEGSRPAPVTAGFVEGSLPLAGGGRVELETLRDRPLVLVFASDTCDVCLEETRAFRRDLAGNDALRIVTALVGAVPEDALEWKRTHDVPWNVGYDTTLDLFRAYCPGDTVPCTLVQLPQKGLVYRHVGLTTVEEIRKQTGG